MTALKHRYNPACPACAVSASAGRLFPTEHAYPVGCQNVILALNLTNGSPKLPDDSPRIPEGIPG